MADPFTPPKAPIVSGVDPYLTNPRTDTGPATMPNRVIRQESGSGFSAGMLVAAVFVVVAIIAAVVYSNRDYFSPAAVDTAPAAGDSNVTIENNAAPAADAPATTPDLQPETAPATAPDVQPNPAPAADPAFQPEADPVVPAPEATAPAPAPVQPAAPANP